MVRIMLVEDDADVRAVVSEFLAGIGHFVVAATSAQQARLILSNERVDLALVDCLMSGEQGNSLAEHILHLEIPTILTSGDPHFIESSAEQAVPFLAKPFRLSALDEVISRILELSRPNEPTAASE